MFLATVTLISACARPYHTFDGEYLYPEPYDRAAAIFHGIICDHAFADGNKRTGTVAAIYILAAEDCLAEYDNLVPLRVALLGEVALRAAQGLLTVQEAAFWIRRIFSSEDILNR